MFIFVAEGKPENPEKKLGVRQETTTNSTHICHQAGAICGFILSDAKHSTDDFY